MLAPHLSSPVIQVVISRLALETTQHESKGWKHWGDLLPAVQLVTAMQHMEAVSSCPFFFYLSCWDCAQEKNISLSSSKSCP